MHANTGKIRRLGIDLHESYSPVEFISDTFLEICGKGLLSLDEAVIAISTPFQSAVGLSIHYSAGIKAARRFSCTEVLATVQAHMDHLPVLQVLSYCRRCVPSHITKVTTHGRGGDIGEGKWRWGALGDKLRSK